MVTPIRKKWFSFNNHRDIAHLKSKTPRVTNITMIDLGESEKVIAVKTFYFYLNAWSYHF